MFQVLLHFSISLRMLMDFHVFCKIPPISEHRPMVFIASRANLFENPVCKMPQEQLQLPLPWASHCEGRHASLSGAGLS
jgi:hypothetical protein